MDGLFAKRVLIALARKQSFASVRRANYRHKYQLKLISPNKHSRPLYFKIDEQSPLSVFTFTSAKWENILKALEGKTILYGKEWKKISSIEEIIVDLELQGYLKRS